MAEYSIYVLERALNFACKELAGGDEQAADVLKKNFLSESKTAEPSPHLEPVEANSFGSSQKPDEVKRAPGSSVPAQE